MKSAHSSFFSSTSSLDIAIGREVEVEVYVYVHQLIVNAQHIWHRIFNVNIK